MRCLSPRCWTRLTSKGILGRRYRHVHRISPAGAALLLGSLILGVPVPGRAAEPPPASEAALKELLKKEPINKENWKTWRGRLKDWSGEHYEATEPAFKEAAVFAKGLLDGKGNLPGKLDGKTNTTKDDTAILFMCLGGATLLDPDPGKTAVLKGRDAEAYLSKAKGADNRIARILYWRGMALRMSAQGDKKKVGDAIKEFEEAMVLDPKIKGVTTGDLAQMAVDADDYNKANPLLTKAFAETGDIKYGHLLVKTATHSDPRYKPQRVALLKPVVDKFPDDGLVHAGYAVALMHEGQKDEAVAELEKARKLNADFSKLGHKADFDAIDAHVKDNQEKFLAQKLKDDPKNHALAVDYAKAVLNRKSPRKRDAQAPPIEELLKEFKTDDDIRALYVTALVHDGRMDEALQQMDLVKGSASASIPKETVKKIQDYSKNNADKFLPQKLKENPSDVNLARGVAKLVTQGKIDGNSPWAPNFEKDPLKKHTGDAEVGIRYAIALWHDKREQEALKQLESVEKSTDRARWSTPTSTSRSSNTARTGRRKPPRRRSGKRTPPPPAASMKARWNSSRPSAGGRCGSASSTARSCC